MKARLTGAEVDGTGQSAAWSAARRWRRRRGVELGGGRSGARAGGAAGASEGRRGGASDGEDMERASGGREERRNRTEKKEPTYF
jgi:hypothetical protein